MIGKIIFYKNRTDDSGPPIARITGKAMDRNLRICSRNLQHIYAGEFSRVERRASRRLEGRIDHYQQQDHFFWIDLIGRPQALCRPLLYRLVLPFE
jgi:hypothetical protein